MVSNGRCTKNVLTRGIKPMNHTIKLKEKVKMINSLKNQIQFMLGGSTMAGKYLLQGLEESYQSK